MSDVSKTNAELIAAEINQVLTAEFAGPASRESAMRHALLSARKHLLSATRVPEQGEASAAIERVRAICAEAKAARARNVATSKRLGYASSSTSERVPGMDDVLAALDGAPEPGWEYEYQWGEPGESFEGFDSFATEELARAEMELDSDYPSHRVMRRRKAGTWLPVKGESRP